MASRFSSDALAARLARCVCTLVVVASTALGVSGCATVRPEEREFLAEDAMSFTARAREMAMDDHILGNREGSMGGGTAGGGGCGCN